MLMLAECVEWSGYKDRDGYGLRSKPLHGERLAHRIAWVEAKGPIPPGLVVRHSCNNPPCVSLEHLMLGTVADNNEDCTAQGRNFQQKKETCPKDHLLDGVKNYKTRSGEVRSRRYCKTCHREREAENRKVKKWMK